MVLNKRLKMVTLSAWFVNARQNARRVRSIQVEPLIASPD